MSGSDIVIFIVGVVLLVVALAGVAFLVWIAMRSELHHRHNRREQALSDARLRMHTHEAMCRLYEVARQAQAQCPGSDSL